MKKMALIISMVVGSLAHASLSSNADLDYGQTPSAQFYTSYQLEKLNAELLRNLYSVEVAGAGAESIGKVNDLMRFANKCDNFATLDDMGKWGQLILEELKRNRYTELYRGAPDLTQSCPNFNSMNDDGREVVWVMVVNAMAHLESSCTLNIPAKGPNGALIGLLQLHNGAEQKYAKYCKKGDGKTAEGTFRCGLSMLEGQLSRDNSLFSRKSYWDVLRPQAKSQKYLKIQKALKNLSICKIGSAPIPSQSEIKNIPVPIPRPSIVEPSTVEEAIQASEPVDEGKQAGSLGGQTGL
ncbi:hypothetical protein AZI86_16390 [Bdellovibrio bacteriovorus]|uniref:Transglycosylase SLT domain-containing protein n=1 Tax=Bdellovibrio bacteriovorus TaxID=959 RepID=A0A150WH40_BDEBC|nr:hypothetical protein [Bdellovibrio bacteriovorus]KYG62411.1 hypothetical protein AZI86_16390 [Bdellovibrio bacteriovorus]